MVIIRKPVLYRPLSTTNVRTENLITKVVRKTGREPVVNRVMSTPVLRDGCINRQTVARGIILTVNAVPLLLPPVVRPIIRSPVTRHAAHPVLILAVIPAIAAVMIPVRPVLLKTITDLMLLLPNAVPDVTDVNGSRSYSGSYVGSSECGSCYACSDTCRSGQKSVSCSSNYVKTRVSTTECGTSCYSCQYNSACNVSSKSCSYGCASYNSCNKCTSCKSAPASSGGGSNDCTWNANGARTISSSCTSYRGYGANATITLPASGISVTMAAHSFWSSATINGGPLVTSHLLVGYDNRYATSHATFNVPVTVNGLITLGNDSTATFNKGISGSYTCRKCTAPSGQTSCKDITCPF